MPDRRAASFELIFRPDIELVSTVRRFVESFYREVLGDPDVVFRLCLATHELLENAVEHSCDDETRLRIEIQRAASGQRVAVVTIHRTSAAKLAALRGHFDELAAEPDPSSHYQKLMRRSLEHPEGSGLGIARVHAEAQMSLRLQVDADDKVHIFAESAVMGEVRA